MEEKKSDRQLGTAPVGRLLLRLSAPMVLAQIVNMLYNVVDRIYIGHIPEIGRLALTGVGLCFPLITIITAFYVLIAQGGAPLAAIEMGRGDNRRAEEYLGGCFTSLIAAAAVLTLAFELFGERLLWIFGASGETIVYALPYMRIYAAGSVFVMLSMGMNLFITTQGFAGYSMASVVLGAVTNIVLDPILIFRCGLGVQGAALATVVSQMLSAAFVLRFLFGKKTLLHVRREFLRPRWALMKKTLALGLAPFVVQTTEAAVSISFNASLQRYGGDLAVGAMTVAGTVMQMISLPANGIGQGAQPIISFNYGARNVARVKKTVGLMFAALSVFLFCGCVLAELLPEVVISIFNSEEALLETAVWALRVYLASFWLLGLQVAAQQVFMATGKARQSLFCACLRKLILLIPLIHLMPLFFENKVFAVFLAEPVADLLSVIICMTLFRFTFWRDMAHLEAQADGRA